MKIVVTTPTGHVGSRVVQLLIQAGIRPTVLVRDPARLASPIRQESDVRQGDLTDIDFVLRETENADALFWLIPVNYQSDDPVGEIVRLGQHAAEAVRKNNIARTVFLSSEGANRKDIGVISGLGEVEEILNATGANILHLRPTYFFTNLLMSIDELRQGVLTTTGALDLKMGWNDPRDIGDIATARLLSNAWTGQNVQAIHGPEDLTFSEVANIAGEAVGRHIEAVQISEDEFRKAMTGVGLSKASVEALLEMERGVSQINYQRDFSSTTLTTLGAWCYANLRPALNASADGLINN